MPFLLAILLTVPTDFSKLTVPIFQKVELAPELVPVCTCESDQGTGSPQQFNIETGDVLLGEANKDDVGYCQINEYWNGNDAKKHGWDIYTEEGNILMANFLFKTQGYSPWKASSFCWKKTVHITSTNLQ